jgi:transposase-like protein
VGIEVNGNQHYNRDGSLKDYYKERSDFIEGLGWELIELPYIMVYNDDVVDNLIKMVSDKSVSIERCEEIIKEKSLEIEINKELNKNKCIDCDVELKGKYKRCNVCNGLNNRKVKDRPPLDQLLKEIEETSYLAVGRKYGVSDNAIRKWIKQYQK